jgi:hypothetical protein
VFPKDNLLSKQKTYMHYAWRQRKKGCDWCVEKVVTSLQVDRTFDARLQLTSTFFDIRVP